MARAYAVILGSLALLTSLARGAVHGGGTTSVLFTAWLSLLVFASLGCAIGWVAGRTVEDSVRSRIEHELTAEAAAGAGKGASRRNS